MSIPSDDTEVENTFDNLEQKQALRPDDEGLMNSVFDNDRQMIKDGELINEAFNQGFDSFIPSTLFESMVNNFSFAKKLYGETFLRELTGYDPDYLSRNVKIPEFQNELKSMIDRKFSQLKEDGLITKEGTMTSEGVDLASFVLYKEELNSLLSRGIYTDPSSKEKSIYGDRKDVRNYRKGDRYKDFSLRKSIRTALKRGHKSLTEEDLRVIERVSKERLSIIYAIDSSSSMKGKKIALSKRAGVALSFKAIQNKDKVGLIVFCSEIEEEVSPTSNFIDLLKKITKIKARGETNLKKTIETSISLFGNSKNKHLILLTDAVPTKGKKPEKETLEAVSIAKANKITVSLVGLKLDQKGEKLAKEMVEMGGGRLYNVKELDGIDKIILEEYYVLKK